MRRTLKISPEFAPLSHRLSCAVASMLVIAGCLGQTSSQDQHVKQLTEHWRWKQYWEGTTELAGMYTAGREFQALLFWRADEMPPSVGFCSVDLGVCQFYPDTAVIEDSFEMKVPSGDDPRSALGRFFAASFGQKASLFGPPPQPKEADYTAELLKITLPALDPPEAIRDRKAQPSAETDPLVASLSCLPDQPGCKVHVLIPFYSHNDPWIPVFTECSACPNTKPMIIFMRFIEGTWWHGAQDYSDSPEFVGLMRKRIEKALMVEVNR
jgi:hypothetical protein